MIPKTGGKLRRLEVEARNLIERRADPENKRHNIVTITRDGIRAIGTLDSVVDRVQHDVLAPLTEVQQRQLIALLTRLLDPAD